MKFPENKREGPGIKQSDVIEVIVNRRKSDITYIINGIKSVRQKNENLRDDTKVFMPYVELYNTKDTI
jgi:bifunctional DNA-binding transcriptional regulator/antitoxin component of YhaV-PrlF toxin-antitoxin module